MKLCLQIDFVQTGKCVVECCKQPEIVDGNFLFHNHLHFPHLGASRSIENSSENRCLTPAPRNLHSRLVVVVRLLGNCRCPDQCRCRAQSCQRPPISADHDLHRTAQETRAHCLTQHPTLVPETRSALLHCLCQLLPTLRTFHNEALVAGPGLSSPHPTACLPVDHAPLCRLTPRHNLEQNAAFLLGSGRVTHLLIKLKEK